MADPDLSRPDHLGQRRLWGREEAFWYGVAFASYVALSVYHKWLLNWFVGPLWLVATLTLGPGIADAVRRRR